jgi:hypothetical protein
MSHPSSLQQKGLSKYQWEEKLYLIGKFLKEKTQLTVMGSGAGILAGQTNRTSMDLDIWKPPSDYDLRDLKQATESAGLLFSPIDEFNPDTPYLQLVEPGICQMGEFIPLKLERMGNLLLEKPPVENLIASKLIRADPKDIEDITFLYTNSHVTIETITKVIQSFPKQKKEEATEALVYLEIITPSKSIPQHSKRKIKETSFNIQ